MMRCRKIPLDPPLEKGEARKEPLAKGEARKEPLAKGEVRRTSSGKERGERQKSEAVEFLCSVSRIFPLM